MVGLGSGWVDVGEMPSLGSERVECLANALEAYEALRAVSSGYSFPLLTSGIFNIGWTL